MKRSTWNLVCALANFCGGALHFWIGWTHPDIAVSGLAFGFALMCFVMTLYFTITYCWERTNEARR